VENKTKDRGRLYDLTCFAAESRKVDTLEALQGLIEAAVREFGFHWFTLLHNVDLSRRGGEPLFLTTYPSAWLEEVLERRHYLQDPIHVACARVSSGIAWDQIGEVLELTERQRVILDRARDHDLVSGYSLPIRMQGEAEAIFTAARSQDAPLHAEDALVVRWLGTVAYDRARELTASTEQKLAYVALSPRQIECLALVAQGKSDWEIGQILSLSRDTVHEYVEGARRRYGVRRRTQLVLRAVRDGHLNMDALL